MTTTIAIKKRLEDSKRFVYPKHKTAHQLSWGKSTDGNGVETFSITFVTEDHRVIGNIPFEVAKKMAEFINEL
jgi:hypothetical protein